MPRTFHFTELCIFFSSIRTADYHYRLLFTVFVQEYSDVICLKATGTAPDCLCSKFINRSSASTLIHREKPSANFPFRSLVLNSERGTSAIMRRCSEIVLKWSCCELRPFRVYGLAVNVSLVSAYYLQYKALSSRTYL